MTAPPGGKNLPTGQAARAGGVEVYNAIFSLHNSINLT